MDNDARTPYKAPFHAQVADGMTRNTIGKIVAESMEGVLQGAWELNRYTESPVDIFGPDEDDKPGARKLGTLRLDWLDD